MVQLLDRIEEMQKQVVRNLIQKHGVAQVCEWAGVKVESTMYAFGQEGKSNLPSRNWVLLTHSASMAGEYEPLELALVAGQRVSNINLPEPNPNVLGTLFMITKIVNEFGSSFAIGDEAECRLKLQEAEKEMNKLRSDLALLEKRYKKAFRHESTDTNPA